MSSKIRKRFFEEITYFGGIFFFIFVIALVLIAGEFDSAVSLTIGLVVIYLLSFLTRLFYFKARPAKQEYTSLIEKLDASSFPSIHAARVTLLAFFSIFIVAYTNHAFFPIYALIILTAWLLTCYSRIYLRKHYLIDVLGGIVLGILSSAAFFVH